MGFKNFGSVVGSWAWKIDSVLYACEKSCVMLTFDS